jgi:hypothetical protein
MLSVCLPFNTLKSNTSLILTTFYEYHVIGSQLRISHIQITAGRFKFCGGGDTSATLCGRLIWCLVSKRMWNLFRQVFVRCKILGSRLFESVVCRLGWWFLHWPIRDREVQFATAADRTHAHILCTKHSLQVINYLTNVATARNWVCNRKEISVKGIYT